MHTTKPLPRHNQNDSPPKKNQHSRQLAADIFPDKDDLTVIRRCVACRACITKRFYDHATRRFYYSIQYKYTTDGEPRIEETLVDGQTLWDQYQEALKPKMPKDVGQKQQDCHRKVCRAVLVGTGAMSQSRCRRALQSNTKHRSRRCL